MALKMVVCAY